MTVDDVFHDLAASRRQGNRSVVGSLALVSFLEEWCNITCTKILSKIHANYRWITHSFYVKLANCEIRKVENRILKI